MKRFLNTKKITGKIIGPSSDIGHQIRDQKFSSSHSTKKQKIKTLIIGGGISGLSAGYYLQKYNHQDFLLLELEDRIGGNSSYGENKISKYPWGGHYLPYPSDDADLILNLLKDFSIIEKKGKKFSVKEEFLCHDPEERLFIRGRWQEGLYPKHGTSQDGLQEKDKFDKLMAEYRNAIGSDGKKAFQIPLDLSSKDKKFLNLDNITFYEFLQKSGFKSKELLWFADYATRDDYGSSVQNTSAWAGIHYYASRPVDRENEEYPVLTWPEGNGYLATKLAEKYKDRILINNAVYQIKKIGKIWEVNLWNRDKKTHQVVQAEHIIYALPQYSRKYILGNFEYHKEFVYSPWMIANLTVNQIPEGKGAPTAWDNVIYNSNSLGYIIATHQNFRVYNNQTVLTYYLPFPEEDVLGARKLMQNLKWEDWKSRILDDLKKAHKKIEPTVENIDVYLNAHAMIRPTKKFLWSGIRQKAGESIDTMHFAHTDLSGISIFEEAHYNGFKAAMKIVQKKV